MTRTRFTLDDLRDNNPDVTPTMHRAEFNAGYVDARADYRQGCRPPADLSTYYRAGYLRGLRDAAAVTP